MCKSAKIIYPVFALLILAAPFVASANYQTLSWEKFGFLTKSDSGHQTNSYEFFYNKLSSAINNFTASLNYQKTDLEVPEQKTIHTVKAKQKIVATAYSSTPDQTDNSPFTTANGKFVREGVAAANFLKFGTKVRFPDVYGDKIFVVEDRMAKRNSHKIDIWMESREQALQFGVKRVNIEILN
jgi:3D (Asp-Asp-Asp) domain-containing protein